jgi:hypothetical protein
LAFGYDAHQCVGQHNTIVYGVRALPVTWDAQD